MKWRMTLFALLLVLGLGGMAAAHGWYYAARDQIRYEAVDIQGDEAALEGLSVEFRYAYDQRLLWTTRMEAGDPAGAETDFSYHLLGVVSPWPDDSERVRLTCPLPLNGGNVTLRTDMDRDTEDPLYRIAWDIGGDLEPGASVTETVRLADYCDVLPLDVYVYSDTQRLRYPDTLNEAVTEDLAIPVPEDLVFSLTVYMASPGSYTSYTTEVISLASSGVILEDGAYFTLIQDEELDFSPADPALGCGVYRIPIEDVGSNIDLVTASVSNFYPLDPAVVRAATVAEAPQAGQLLVYTYETGGLFLNVVELASGRTLRRVALPGDTMAEQQANDQVLLLATQSESDLYLTALDLRDGSYGIWMTEIWTQEQFQSFFRWGGIRAMAFDGDRLALACTTYFGNAIFQLAVFDAAGQRCSAQYLCDAVLNYPSPGTDTPLILTWQ